MARLVFGPVLARVERIYEGSTITCPEGQVGILEIRASERKYPGKHFVTFYYEPGVPAPADGDLADFATSRFFRSSCGTLGCNGDKVTLTNTRDGAYEFTVLAVATELS